MNIKTIVVGISLMCFVGTSNAQFGKLFKKKDGDDGKTEEAAAPPHTFSAHHTANMGKVVFYNKDLDKNSASDTDAGKITEREIGGEGSFYFRAYLENGYSKACEGCDGMDIRYTIGGVSLTTQDVRDLIPGTYGRMASAMSFYDYDNRALGIPLDCGPGKYVENYTLQEDTYRILLSKVKDQLVTGATVTMKVEVLATKANVEGAVLAVGEIPLKVTAASKNLQSLMCRCAKAGMTDEKVEKAVAEAFAFQFNDVKEVYKVILNGRDFEVNGDSKGMYANIIYLRTDGIFLQIKRYIYFSDNGDGYSDKATIGKHVYFIPVSPTCAEK